MRILHISDLHIGRRLCAIPLDEDIQYMLDKVLDLAQKRQVDAIVVAGDVYDSPVPSEAAVRIWNEFLQRVAALEIKLLVVSGNHDSGPRLGCGASLMDDKGIYISGDLTADISPVVVDGINFWLVPFVRPSQVRAWADELGLDSTSVTSYDSAFGLICSYIYERPEFANHKNVLIAHQFITWAGRSPETSDSERMSLGTLDNIDAGHLMKFDYVALGHIHRPQQIGADYIRYAGSPLKLSSSEVRYKKSFTLVDIDEQGCSFELCEFEPWRDYRIESGSLDQLLVKAAEEDENRSQDFISAVIVDDEQTDAMAKLRRYWPNLVEMSFDNAQTRALGVEDATEEIELIDSYEDLFDTFFQAQAGRSMNQCEMDILANVLEEMGKE